MRARVIRKGTVKAFLLLFLVFVGSATASMPDIRDVVITLERTLCLGACPAYTVTIYGNGTVIYEGKNHVKVRGRQTAAISREKVTELISEFQKIDYFSLRDSYEQHHVTDFPSANTSIRINGREKAVRHYGADRTAPRELRDLERKIDEIAGTERWIKGLPEKDVVTPGGSSTQGQDNKAIASQLRNEGYSLQKNGDLRGAIRKYGESLRYWPDKQLEKHINLLELRLQGKISDSKEPHDEVLCGLVDLSEAAVPADFVISYVTGPQHAEWGGRRVLKVYADGNVAVTQERRKDRFSPPVEETLYKQIPVAGVRKIYAHVSACGFFDLEKQYWNRDVRDGGSEYLEVSANGKRHGVRVYYCRVERFRSIVSVLEEETSKGP